MNLPLSVYDFFGYLASGFLILAAAEFGFDGHWLVDREWKPGAIALYVTMALMIGHIAANMSSWLIEHQFGRELLGPSEELLFRDEKKEGKTIWERLFPGFHKPFHPRTRERILEVSKLKGFTDVNRALYVHAFAVVKQDKATLDRLNTFLNQYGFCRNMAFSLLVAVAIMPISGVWYALHGDTSFNWDKFGVGLMCIVGSVGMLYRYLKFYRLYTVEVMMTYPELKTKEDKKDSKE